MESSSLKCFSSSFNCTDPSDGTTVDSHIISTKSGAAFDDEIETPSSDVVQSCLMKEVLNKSNGGGANADWGVTEEDLNSVSSENDDEDNSKTDSLPPLNVESTKKFTTGGFQIPDNADTFRGTLGGVAEDADLLAELMAISNKTNRFDDPGTNAIPGETGTKIVIGGRELGAVQKENESGNIDIVESSIEVSGTTKNTSTRPLPPWKRKGTKNKSVDYNDQITTASFPSASVKADDTIIVTAKTEQTEAVATSSCGQFQSDNSLPKTFIGDRGGAAEDADLLAELRAISNKSSTRFGGNDDGSAPENKECVYGDFSHEQIPKDEPSGSTHYDVGDTELLCHSQNSSGNKDNSNKFHDSGTDAIPGETGTKNIMCPHELGAAQKDKNESGGIEMKSTTEVSENPKKTVTRPLPPWKRKETKMKNAAVDDNHQISIVSPPSSSMKTDDKNIGTVMNEQTKTVANLTRGQFQFDNSFPKTFNGNLGGAAEDADLLAELRAISNKSSTRFGGNDDGTLPAKKNNVDGESSRDQIPKHEPSGFTHSNVDLESEPSRHPQNSDGNEDNSNTFHDLRTVAIPGTTETEIVISGNESGVVQKDDSESGGIEIVESSTEVSENPKKTSTHILPPWKRNGMKTRNAAVDDNDQITILSSPTSMKVDDTVIVTTKNEQSKTVKTSSSGQFQSDNFPPQTFNGDRGGAAEDADLLAELRAISNNSSTRFGVNDDVTTPVNNDRVDDESSHWRTKKHEPSGGIRSNVSLDTELSCQYQNSADNEDKSNIFDHSRSHTLPAETGIKIVISENESGFDKKESGCIEIVESSTEVSENPMKTATRSMSPWKRKGTEKTTAAVDDNYQITIASFPSVLTKADDTVIVTANNEQTEAVATLSCGQFQSDNCFPKTFKGDRGGSAEDADLLAELRAISNKSSTRFGGNDDGSAPENKECVYGDFSHEQIPKDEPSGSTHSGVASETKYSNQSQNSADNKDSSNRFDDSGTDAIPRAIGTKIVISANQSGVVLKDSVSGGIEIVDSTADVSENPKKTVTRPLPPWKRKGTKTKIVVDNDNDQTRIASASIKSINADDTIIVTAKNEHTKSVVTSSCGQFQSDNGFAKTFNGDRGGSAEDADLLAELRAISNKSSSRFGGKGETTPPDNKECDDGESSRGHVPKHKHSGFSHSGVASETEYSNQSQNSADNKDSSDSFHVSGTYAIPGAMGTKIVMSGNESGAALKDSVSGGFEIVESITEVSENLKKTSTRPFPPWKRKVTKTKTAVDDDMDQTRITYFPSASIELINADDTIIVTAKTDQTETVANSSCGQFQSDNCLPKTFNGDRGGSAEDADLLAELRAISNKSSTRFGGKDDDTSQGLNTYALQSTVPVTLDRDRGNTAKDTDFLNEHPVFLNKFSTNISVPLYSGNDDENQKSMNVTLDERQDNTPVKGKFIDSTSSQSIHPYDVTLSSNVKSDEMISNAVPATSSPFLVEEDNVNAENLQDSLVSKKWQIRKESYSFLHRRLVSALSDKPANNQLEEDNIIPSFRGIIIQALNEKNAGALDVALALSILYVDSCKGACTEDCLKDIVCALLKGIAFSSSRKPTMLLVGDLVMKIIEVSPDNSQTIQTTLDLLQKYGLKSRNPKVVIFSAKVLLRSVQTFGVGSFPVQTLSSQSEMLLSNVNNDVRDVGLNIAAELCRSLGSKAPLQPLIDKMKPAQQTQLNYLLECQLTSTEPNKRLRCQEGVPISSRAPEDVLFALKHKEQEDKAKLYASRPEVDVFQVLPQTCYKEKIKLEKWSEKVAAIDALLHTGGEQPFKLVQPSTTVNYGPLVRDLTQLLGHTHFAVVSKSLDSLGMFAEGVGEQMFPLFRPLITTLVGLFKDKKVCKAVSSCLDKMFGNVFGFEHLLDSKDSLPSSLDEKRQKHAFVRVSVLEHLNRCVKASKGRCTRGKLNPEHANVLSKLACDKLQDSDAATRKAACDILLSLLRSDDESIKIVATDITALLQTTNPRVYKSLQQPTNVPSLTRTNSGSRPTSAPANPSLQKPANMRPKTAGPGIKASSTSAHKQSTSANVEDSISGNLPLLEEAVNQLTNLGIPHWSEDVDCDGILAGIQSTSWQKKVGALNKLISYIEMSQGGLLDVIPSLFVLVKTYSSSFKESNFNVAKSLLRFFIALFTHVFERLAQAPETYLYSSATKLAVDKISDKKLYESSAACLTSICVVKNPQKILAEVTTSIVNIKSPLAHESSLLWFKSFCVDFGALLISENIPDILVWILNDCESKNVKVKAAAVDVIAELYTQLGTPFQSFVISKAQSQGLLQLMEKSFTGRIHDPAAISAERRLRCVTLSASSKGEKSLTNEDTASNLKVPSIDITSLLGENCLDRMGFTDGKNSWKLRKEAIEEVIQASNKCSGLLSTDAKAFANLKELLVALRCRMSDSQSNLKPITACAIEALLSRVEDSSQVKLAKIIFPTLITTSMNDMKKAMRDASLSALSAGTRQSELNGSSVNVAALDVLIATLQSELSDAALKSTGLQDVLSLLIVQLRSMIGQVQKSMSTQLQLSKIIVGCLLSPKEGTRATTEKLLALCSENAIVPTENFETVIGKLLPAQQRSVRLLIPELTSQESKKAVSPRSSVLAANLSSSTSKREAAPRKLITPSPSLSANTVENDDYFPSKPDENDPLLLIRLIPNLKQHRLALLFRGDDWPEYPDEPSGDAVQQALRKSWSPLIQPSSAHTLFPTNTNGSMDCFIEGCGLIMKSIAHSRKYPETTIIDQLDLIFKWSACALSSRDHTVGLRSLLSMIFALFERLHEMSYTINTAEANILLPVILDKAGIVKTPFQDQFLRILSYVETNDIYPSKEYGSLICVKVIDKSAYSKSRSLASSQCISCVQKSGLAAIGKRGLSVLGRTLSTENLVENRTAYLNLFEVVVGKLDGDLEKLFSICGSSFSEKGKIMIAERCCRRQTHAERHNENPQTDMTQLSRLRTPSRKSSARHSEQFPSIEDRNTPTSNQESSAAGVATASLRQRFQRVALNSLAETNAAEPGELAGDSVPSGEVCFEVFKDIDDMVQKADSFSSDNVFVTRGMQAIARLSAEFATRRTFVLDDRHFNLCLEKIASVVQFAFKRNMGSSLLPTVIVENSISSLVGFTKTKQYSTCISQDSLTFVLGCILDCLFDNRLDAHKEQLKMINKLAIRLATAPPRDISLLTLLSLQQTALSAYAQGHLYNPKFGRVIEKLVSKVARDELENPNPLQNIDLESLLMSLDVCLVTIENARVLRPRSDDVLKPASNMTMFLMTELIRCKTEAVRKAIEHLGLCNESITSLVATCEKELGVEDFSAVSDTENKISLMASLINRVSNAEGEERTAAVDELSKFKESDPEFFQSQLSHVSVPFQEFIVNKRAPDSSSADLSERIQSINRLLRQSEGSLKKITKNDPTDVPPTTSTFSMTLPLSAKIEALKRENNSSKQQNHSTEQE